MAQLRRPPGEPRGNDPRGLAPLGGPRCLCWRGSLLTHGVKCPTPGLGKDWPRPRYGLIQEGDS
eukprot:9788179-Prorocentrum_lima.AAC.1